MKCILVTFYASFLPHNYTARYIPLFASHFRRVFRLSACASFAQYTHPPGAGEKLADSSALTVWPICMCFVHCIMIEKRKKEKKTTDR